MKHERVAMTVAEFCGKYHIDDSTYYRNVRKGRMPHPIKVGGATRILIEDEQQWLANQRKAA
jgi:predicted DNA-binding transcriptional regulator AlpA